MQDKNLAESHPELALEADGWDSSNFTAKMNNVGAWVCALGHRWTAVISVRASNGYGCPFCSGERIFSGFNDLATLYPELAAEADGWDPTIMKSTYAKTLDWRCAQGHSWKSTLKKRFRNNDVGCPYCANKIVWAGFNDLATTHPHLAKQAFGWEPSTIIANYSYPKGWKCALGHEWQSTPSSRAQRGRGCPYCAGKKILVGYNDLATTHPLIAAQAHNWDPTTISSGSDFKREWLGPCGHTWIATVSHRVSGKGCSPCAGKTVVVGVNDFASNYPELAKQAYGWDPKTVTKGSSRQKEWLGLCGHTWVSSPKSRASGLNCAYCAGKKVLVGFNDLKTTHPEVAAEALGWNPETRTAGSDKKEKWKGTCGHTWVTKVRFRTNGSGCPPCNAQGYSIGKPGWVYVLVGHVRNHVVVQFGISNVPKKRLAKHRLAGFDAVPLALIHFESGADALAEENRLKALQASHGVLTATKTGVIFDGSTEGFVWHKSANSFVDVLCDELNIDKTVFLKQVAVHTFEASLYDGLIY